ncbi:ferritin-like domain-containing protein [Zunongwangia profunda]|uniref:ferritin-like domain-containing protein n=1 Tax=Zunongwangia profunda TaxID=398743 RepID=UPI001D18D409|nr:ferritin-like domain-containing protein [Zunongwangia profunda]MCC4227997.1 ferritin-like domain-containing protein [Zunongwangia profunda]|tara:strand:+ start:7675 stop:8457 length:783 start_codon:yes stop_codon:yes gene_type:complete
MKKPVVKVEFGDKKGQGNSRRRFIKMSGLAFAGSTLLYACSEDDDFNPGMEPEPEPTPDPDPEAFDLGSGDVGILNYALALEQLEAAFYQMVLDGDYFAGASDEEKTIMTDLRNHEVIHREVLRTALNSVVDEDMVIPELEFDFSEANVDFSDRTSVLNTALLLEDTGVSAYNGAGKLISNADYLLVAGQIVSVEARHASAIADLINPGSTDFARNDVLVDLGGSGVAYDKAQAPSEILEAVVGLGVVQTPFTANNLPTE